MPRLIITEGAALGPELCSAFLAEPNSQITTRAGQVITVRLLALESTHDIGQPFDREPTLRELPISFGATGYIALYRHEPVDDAVYVLAFRHQRVPGYR